MKAIPLRRRTNIRSLANALQVGKSTVHQRIKEGSVRPHSNAVKPFLTDDNKKSRVNFCLSMINKVITNQMDDDIGTQDRGHKRIHSVESIVEPERGTSDGNETKMFVDLGPQSQGALFLLSSEAHQMTDPDLEAVNQTQRPKFWRPLKACQVTDPDLEAINQTASTFQRCSLNKPVTIATGKQQLYNNISKSLRIVVVGDIHEEWNLLEDELALRFLQPDLVLFTGDIGNENVELVRSVASLQMPKAVILGNHDSWGTQKFSAKIKDNIQLQLECLGEEHVGYSRLDFPMLKLSVVGGRPFSCGGEQLFRKKLLTKRYGIKDMDGSAKQISKAALGTPEDHLVILLAHNGPTGLGCNRNDICGKDWVEGGGDHGDPDLAQAISDIKETSNLCIPLVVFGHMHKQLGNGNRKMTLVGDDNTVYVNGAIVPRVKEQGMGNKRAFTVVDFLNGSLSKIAETWVSVIGNQATLADEQVLFMIHESSF